jgi:exodeoxyribonuclease V gamma subunit
VQGHELLRAQLRQRQNVKPIRASSLSPAGLHSESHPLLASWGKQARDYLHMLDGFDQLSTYAHRFSRVDVFVDPLDDAESPSILSQLQSSIFNLQGMPDKREALQKDESITLITCHSAQREVEVLHDRLLAWFNADPKLQPRDVMVMVPDMQTFAAHIAAVFGRFASGEPRHIPYSIADTTPRQSPIVQALEQLLKLPTARLSLADWLSLFEVSAVRARFGLSAADVTQLHDWLALAGVRWGLDAQYRVAWGLPCELAGLDQNTWAFGLRRLLLGYAVGHAAPWGGTFGQAALGSLDAPLMGALLEWLQAIQTTQAELSSAQSPAQWGLTLSALVTRFFLAQDEAQERLLQRCLAPLEPWLQACADARLESQLSLDVVRDHWLAQIEESSLQQRFFGGGVQFGTLMPMRSIPFQVIGLLGMNDGDYPRQKPARDFDLMAQSWRAGDRSRREDDRYLFLEALLAARQKLYISWQGHSATDNSEQPPSVLVAQLIDYVQMHLSPSIVVQKQPLQAFSQAYFLQDSPFETYADDWARVHAADTGTAATCEVLESGVSPTALTLAHLRQLLRQPVEVFFKARLQVWLNTLDEELPEEEPFALNALAQFQATQNLLDAADPELAAQQLTLGGVLPLGAFGARASALLQDKAQTVRERCLPWLQRYPTQLGVQSIDLEIDGKRLTGVLGGLRMAHDHTLLLCRQRAGALLDGKKGAQSLRVHAMVDLWVQHLAACASALALTSVQLGVDAQVLLKPLDAEAARSRLQRLLQVYQQAWVQPLPVACKTASAYLHAQIQALQQGDSEKAPKDPHDAAQLIFEGGSQAPGECEENVYLARAFVGYDDIKSTLPELAQALYGDLIAHVQISVHEGGSA